MGSTRFNHANRIWVQTEPCFMTPASPFLAAWGQAASSPDKPPHPLPGAGTHGDAADNSFCLFSFLSFSKVQPNVSQLHLSLR